MKLFVGNLGFNTEQSTLEAAFAAYGEVSSVAIITDQYTGRSRGFGFVEMTDKTQAEAAMRALNGSMLDGRALTVNEARERTESRSGGGGGGNRGGGDRDSGNRRW